MEEITNSLELRIANENLFTREHEEEVFGLVWHNFDSFFAAWGKPTLEMSAAFLCEYEGAMINDIRAI